MGSRPERCPAPFRRPPPSPATNTTKTAPLLLAEAMAAGMAPWNHSISPLRPPCSLGVLSSRPGAGPALPFAGPRGPGSPSWPAPRPQLRRDAHTQRSLGTRANARAGSAWRHVIPHVAVGLESHCLVWLASWRVRATARP